MPQDRKTSEAVAAAFLVVVGLVAAQRAATGDLGAWLGGKFLNRGELPPQGSGPVTGGGARRGVNPPPGASEAAERPRGPGGGPFKNGRLPASWLASIGEGGQRLDPAAASAYIGMKKAAAAEGVRLEVTDSYRTYAGQIAVKIAKPSLAAAPGTSVHGWGRAIDVASGGGRREWVQANGARYGWVWPTWAQPGGSKPEPWHFEYSG